MVTRCHGPQQNTRDKLKKKTGTKGKISVVKYLQEFKVGDNVLINVEPGFKKNLIHRRFMKKSGIVVEKRGEAYRVRVKDLNKEKDVFVLPVHLKRL
ncbi:50S ribosomal protein L21e [archaeon CG_4_10_14_0_2_um_filter_Archaea_38_6]|nr:MAG: 50S ribosomal protein L21e [archaeon CG07_land_8_20_14_0_80_38_8]PIX44759.1 MAG: 50S ribosomal protein L21e [archaeon CG_4_8_14_3_um_filter_38_5]PJA21699.1 MAG: 50S ribosomal protein L21e [archaeon CG_4_10_14_0_2_um_filter_Archaea_38_6]